MTSLESASAFSPEETEQPSVEAIETIKVADSEPLPSSQYVIDALKESVKSGAMSPGKATQKYNSWQPEHPIHQGYFE